MSARNHANWHTANGGALPFRPPTVDDALPYSPFSSIVPFSPDIIPFPSAEPPTPPPISSSEQDDARTAVELLNVEINGSHSTSQYLQKTLEDLRGLLDPNELSQFHFKPITQLATPPPDRPNSTSPTNGSATKGVPLSPFASMLLRNTDVSHLYPGMQSPQQRPRQPGQHSSVGSHLQSQATNRNDAPRVHKSNLQYQPSISPSTPNNTQRSPSVTNNRSGPKVVIQPQPLSSRRDEFQRYDNIEIQTGFSKKRKREDTREDNDALSMRSDQRQVTDQRVKELFTLVDHISDAKDSGEPSNMFIRTRSEDSEILVLEDAALERLDTAVTNVVHAGRFASLPVEQVLRIQSLCEPSILSTIHLPLDWTGSELVDDWLNLINKADTGLKACRTVLRTMIGGCDEKRICSEDLVLSAINALKRVLDSCIVPVVESSSNSDLEDYFKLASTHKSDILAMLSRCGFILSDLAALIAKVGLTESALTPLEYLSTGVIFVQEAEKDKEKVPAIQLFGIQKFETLRDKAMNVLAQIFACHPDQRAFISNEIHSNLEKLPKTRQHARQFKLAHGSPIQLVAALVMRLVHAGASRRDSEKKTVSHMNVSESDDEDDDDLPRHGRSVDGLTEDAGQISKKLNADATTIAMRFIKFLVDRAMTVSKSSDLPYRNLLDIFTEDFCGTLGSPEWPAAELLLQALLSLLLNILDKDSKEHGIPARTMVLEILGTMGSSIVDLKGRMQQSLESLSLTTSQSEISSQLVPIARDALGGGVNDKDLLAIHGPYRMVLEGLPEYLDVVDPKDNPHLQSVKGCHITFWTHAFDNVLSEMDEDEAHQPVTERLGRDLKKLVLDPNWLSTEFESKEKVTIAQSRLAAGIITLQGRFCKFLPNLINLLISNTNHTSAALKARSMRSLTQLIEKDSSILDDQTFKRIINLMRNDSTSVRDNALQLVQKCLAHRSSLGRECLDPILSRVTDSATTVKKRAIKLLKGIYSNAETDDVKLRIVERLLYPLKDDDHGVADLARQIFEDIWLVPLTETTKSDNAQLQLDRNKQVSLLVQTVERIQSDPSRLEALEYFFKSVLSDKSKNVARDHKICKDLVVDMFEGVIGTDLIPGENSQPRILRALSIFASVNPKLFSPKQVQLLKLYVKNLGSTNDLAVFRPTVIVFRFVFPSLSSLHENFLEEVRASLLSNVGKLSNWTVKGLFTCKETLVAVAQCLWMISPLVKGNPQARVKSGIEKLITTVCSTMTLLKRELAKAPSSFSNPDTASGSRNKILAYLLILGTFGQHCDFNNYIDIFKKLQPDWRGTSIPVLLIETILPCTKQAWKSELAIRRQALESLGQVCQNTPKHFMRADVEAAFKQVFELGSEDQSVELKGVVLAQFCEFFASEERRSESGAEIAVGEGAIHGAERLDTSLVANDNDGAALHLAQKFLSDIVRIALETSQDLAVTAADIVVSVSRQGLVHPKECGPALIALETSPDSRIFKKAFMEHQSLHHKHETMFEKEYTNAVFQAFEYQRNVLHDTHGAIDKTYKPKLHLLFDVLKGGSRKVVKKFLKNICQRIDFEPAKFDSAGDPPTALLYARFCLENLGFFDYAHVDEIVHLLSTIESIVKQTGAVVAHAIETEILNYRLETEQQALELTAEGLPVQLTGQDSTKGTVDEARLRHLAVASMILHMMWETRSFIRKQWSMQGKLNTKDLQKSAIKTNFITGKELWESMATIMTGLDNPDRMKEQCKAFAELISVDKEMKVGEDDDADEQLARAAEGYETPNEDGKEGVAQATSGKGRKRKSNVATSNTPKKAKRGRLAGSKSKNKRNSKTPDDSEDDDD
ncbi:hypothetical protein K469DRAFT_737494 [Zopfia rhizophila CBS 207.26]|uniref:Sister chromatid cohesion protein n=1 Tax=Zopfia rhizophila CBS 207.26 TaxID=1314779 RepID=A0A6A6EDA5_9PEZI|nr:hypothetical protein K469DRAFT_737494 [Zopfia rhizophila CBS 207.26]